MPRAARDDGPGVVHHVMVRGIERREIFRDDRDRRELLRRLSMLVPELGFRCYAWALMPNHIHLVVQSGSARVSRLMARLGTGYARYFNERHERVGHLFQNRFRSRRVLGDEDLVGLVLYVVRNPLEGGLVPDARMLERFPWCSLGSMVGTRVPYRFESVADGLALFDPDLGRARHKLREHLCTVDAAAAAPSVLLQSLARAPKACPDARHPSLEYVLRQECASCGADLAELRSRGRNQRLARARAAVARRAARELGFSGAEIARALGMTRSAVSKMLSRTD